MNLNPQIIENEQGMKYALLEYNEFLIVQEIIENYEDLVSLRIAVAKEKHTQGKSAAQLLKELAN